MAKSGRGGLAPSPVVPVTMKKAPCKGWEIANVFHRRVLARIPKLAVQKFFWEWPNICVGMVALKVFWDINRNCSYKTHVLER